MSLLSTQQWAYIASNLDTRTSNYLVTFTGLVSIASAIGGCVVEHLVNLGGVQFLLLSSFIACLAGFISSEVAYYLLGTNLISTYSFGMLKNIQSYSNLGKQLNSSSSSNAMMDDIPTSSSSAANLASLGEETQDMTAMTASGTLLVDQSKAKAKLSIQAANESQKKPPTPPKYPIYKAPSLNLISTLYQAIINFVEKKKTSGFWFESYKLVQKHHLLKLLFVEALTHQCCTNMLNLMFHNSLRKEIEEDSVRAMLVGRFFATVNISSCALQCFVLPHIMSHSSLPTVLLYLPIIVFFAVMLGVVKPGIISVMIGFGTIKV